MSNITDQPTSERSSTKVSKTLTRSKILGILGAIVFGTAGFYITYANIFNIEIDQSIQNASLPEFNFIALDPLIISLQPNSNAKLLKFTAQIEVTANSTDIVEHMRPRIIDMMNQYLRAVQPDTLTEPAIMLSLREQLLRRAQTIVGPGHIRDILIIEFVLS
jgi:flagellar FliL protein